MDHEGIEQRLPETARLNHPSVMTLRAAVQTVGGYHAEFEPAEDFDLWLRLGEVGRLANLPEVLMKYRQYSWSSPGESSVMRVTNWAPCRWPPTWRR